MKLVAPLSAPTIKIISRLSSSSKKIRIGKVPKWGSRSESDYQNYCSSLLVDGDELSDGSSRGGRSRNRHRHLVPKGYIAVYVGPELRRFVIPISFLTMPDFRVLMEKVAEEFGCEYDGAFQFPCCEEYHFEQILISCSATHHLTSSSDKPLKMLPH